MTLRSIWHFLLHFILFFSQSYFSSPFVYKLQIHYSFSDLPSPIPSSPFLNSPIPFCSGEAGAEETGDFLRIHLNYKQLLKLSF